MSVFYLQHMFVKYVVQELVLNRGNGTFHLDLTAPPEGDYHLSFSAWDQTLPPLRLTVATPTPGTALRALVPVPAPTSTSTAAPTPTLTTEAPFVQPFGVVCRTGPSPTFPYDSLFAEILS
jgi:hypothetical protein